MKELGRTFRYEVVPLGYPDASELITAFNYNLYTRQIHVTLKENENFDAYRWLVSIKDLYDQASLHPHLKGKDQIEVRSYAGKKQIATQRFGRLLIMDHTCVMGGEEHPIEHNVKIGCERIEIDG